MVKGVVFDCFGVLYGGSLLTLLDMCPEARRAELIDWNKQNDYGYLTADEYARGVAGIVGASKEAVEQIFQQKRVRNYAMFDFVRTLRPSYKVGLLTNAGRDMPNKLFTAEERAELFDAIVLSSDVGLTKPNPEIYEIMAEKLGLKTGDCIMVDDTFENIEGADAAGMKGVWFTTTAGTIIRIEDQLRTG